MSRINYLFMLPVLVVSTACSHAQDAAAMRNRVPDLALGNQSAVYQETHLNSWQPSAWMPAEAPRMISVFDIQCRDNPHTGATCIRVRIDRWAAPNWCGIAWTVPNPQRAGEAYWAEQPAAGWDMRGATRVAFWARSPQRSRVQFKACVLGDKPYGDASKLPAQTDYITLTPEWRQYYIDLKGAGIDLSRVVSSFCFVTSRDQQSRNDQPVEFYLDDIAWEFASAAAVGTPDAGKPGGLFVVYDDTNMNDWVPASWMPEQASMMITTFDPACTDNPKLGKNCLRVQISRWAAPYWAGVAWTIPHPQRPGAAYWGEEPAPGWDLRGAKRVVFWARAPQPVRVQFKVSVMGDKVHGDSAKFPAQTEFITLTPEWKEYAIDVSSGVDLARVVSGFCFVTNRDVQARSDAPVEFFLDGIAWQVTPPAGRTAK